MAQPAVKIVSGQRAFKFGEEIKLDFTYKVFNEGDCRVYCSIAPRKKVFFKDGQTLNISTVKQIEDVPYLTTQEGTMTFTLLSDLSDVRMKVYLTFVDSKKEYIIKDVTLTLTKN